MPLFGPPDINKLKDHKDVKGLIKALSYTKDMNVAVKAAQALGNLGNPQAVDALNTTLHDEKWKRALDVPLKALLQINDLQYFKLPDTVNTLTEILNAAPNTSITEAAIAGLEKSDDPRAVQPLINALSDNSNTIKMAATRALAEIGDPASAGPLANILEKEAWIALLETASSGLCKIGPEAIKFILPVLNSSNSGARKAALDTLVKIGAPAVPELLNTLNNNDLSLQISGCEALGEIGEGQAFEPLMAILNNAETDKMLKRAAASGLVKLGWEIKKGGPEIWFRAIKQEWGKLIPVGSPAVEPLLACMMVESESECKKILEALVKIGADAVEPLITALTEDNWTLRQVAAMALGDIGDPKAKDPLKTAFKKDGWDINDRYAEALKKLGEKLPQPSKMNAAEEERAILTLNQICAAYESGNEAKYKKLEAEAKRIGEDANERGGMMEMRRLYHKLKKSPGQRNLELLWSGIGHWLG